MGESRRLRERAKGNEMVVLSLVGLKLPSGRAAETRPTQKWTDPEGEATSTGAGSQKQALATCCGVALRVSLLYACSLASCQDVLRPALCVCC